MNRHPIAIGCEAGIEQAEAIFFAFPFIKDEIYNLSLYFIKRLIWSIIIRKRKQ